MVTFLLGSATVLRCFHTLSHFNLGNNSLPALPPLPGYSFWKIIQGLLKFLSKLTKIVVFFILAG